MSVHSDVMNSACHGTTLSAIKTMLLPPGQWSAQQPMQRDQNGGMFENKKPTLLIAIFSGPYYVRAFLCIPFCSFFLLPMIE